ncbi:hypothetical protein [Lentzea kentuckyensis]|uniref:hypothetical protein n=1 Tax=Lentzea kentuckyensis TaxID=360086 RepID=UPI001302E5F8|nr:hypothetical protein [Lentzea kentuckyensis]
MDFAGTDLFTVGSGVFTAQRHVEDLLTLTSQLRPDHTGKQAAAASRKSIRPPLP